MPHRSAVERLLCNVAGEMSCGFATSARRTKHSSQSASRTQASASTTVPAFDEALTKELLQPHILAALRPESQSALELTHILWPKETALRHAMRSMVGRILTHTATMLCKHMHAGLMKLLLSDRDLLLSAPDVCAYHCMASLSVCV